MNYDEYMKAIVGDTDMNQFNNSRYDAYSNVKMPNTYREDNYIDLAEPTRKNIDLYPNIFVKLNPMIINRCKTVTEKVTKELITRITDEIYLKISAEINKEIKDNPNIKRVSSNYNLNQSRDRENDSFLRDLIQILVLNQLLK